MHCTSVGQGSSSAGWPRCSHLCKIYIRHRLPAGANQQPANPEWKCTSGISSGTTVARHHSGCTGNTQVTAAYHDSDTSPGVPELFGVQLPPSDVGKLPGGAPEWPCRRVIEANSTKGNQNTFMGRRLAFESCLLASAGLTLADRCSSACNCFFGGTRRRTDLVGLASSSMSSRPSMLPLPLQPALSGWRAATWGGLVVVFTAPAGRRRRALCQSDSLPGDKAWGWIVFDRCCHKI